jgi:hypothetical protein
MKVSFDKKRRFFRVAALRVADPKDAAIADEVRRLGYHSMFNDRTWSEILPDASEARQFRRLYRAFLRMARADASWFGAALEWFSETFGAQVVVGLAAIAHETQRSTSGALRLIEGGKLPAAKIAGEFVSTVDVLRPHRRHGDSAVRQVAA